jgi:hypothetical protein
MKPADMTQTSLINNHRLFICVSLLSITSGACTSDTVRLEQDKTPNQGAVSDTAAKRFATSSVVLDDDSSNTYLSLLRSLDSQTIDYGGAREFAGWADVWVHEGKVFVADGESPTVTRFSVDAGIHS